MPFYTIHCAKKKKKEEFSIKLVQFHAQTFGGDANTIRVEFNSLRSSMNGDDVGVRRCGGLKPKAKGLFGREKLILSDYIVVQMAFKESPHPELWQEYCRKVAELYGNTNISIYLQKLEMEVEFGNFVPAGGLERREGAKE
ncbi:hypothetical protein BLS_005388 [Venturia inaequalis]|uniref:Uncharacterized protein n=1 Tax=Venturia inaequalis TaxID=5025 RepID=A0A8H3UG65_VENIN|nr:hypothetical protein BLS_005388 [Venturia inaequalis]